MCEKIGSRATPRGGSDVYLSTGSVTLIRSQNVHNSRFQRDGLVYLTDRHAEELSNVEVVEGDVLLNITGDSVARCCEAPADVLPARVNQHVAIIRPKSNMLDPRYLKCFFVSPAMQEHMLQLAGAGATRNALTKGMIESFQVPCPPIAEQRRIAHVLGTLDDKIDLNRRMNETLEAMAREVFRSWFVDFDPVRANADGRQPDGLDAATAALFLDKFEDSPLGPVPKGWRVGSLLEQAELLSEGTPDTSEQSYWDGCIPWASAKDVSQCGQTFLVDTERCITEAGLENSSTKIIPVWSTVVVARGATTGRLTMFGENIAMNQTCYALRSRLGSDSALYCQLRETIERLVNTAHVSVFDTITTRTFHTVPILLPPEPLLKAFEERVRPLFAIILNRLNESRTLASLRDALLPKLLAGEVQPSMTGHLAMKE
jgi:type I restriction enzyme S subunit